MSAPPLGSTPAAIGQVSVADAAASHLRGLLFAGRFDAGQELRDSVIAQELGIARPTARIAVQRLVDEGLLERRPGRSARVRSFTPADVVDVIDLRRLIELEAVRLIIEDRRDTADVAAALEAFRRAGDSWEAGPDADARFHIAVVAASGSPRLARMFATLASEMRLIVALLRDRYHGLRELSEEHASLLRALEAGDLAAARATWREHLDDAERFLTALLAEPGRTR